MRRPAIVNNRNSPSGVRPRVTKHLYRPASADHAVHHLGSPISRTKPYFVFAGKEFFQRTANYSPLYQRALIKSVNFIRYKYFFSFWLSISIRMDHIDPTTRISQMNPMLRHHQQKNQVYFFCFDIFQSLVFVLS